MLEEKFLLSPTISINDVTVTEGNTDTVNAAFTVSLSSTSMQSVTVQYSTMNGTAMAPSDCTSASGMLSFAPGQTSQTINISVIGDTTPEPNETFYVNLSNPMNATITRGQGTGTIMNDDNAPPPSISINDVTVTEGNSGTVNAIFTVNLSAASSQSVSVQYATQDGTATAPSDYAPTSGTLMFAPGQTSKTITVTVNGDTLVEPNETFYVNLTMPTNATLADSQGMGTITNDDTAPPTISINDMTVTEGNTGITSATFAVSLSTSSGQTVTVQYNTADGTATAPGDYAATSGTLSFAPGETAKSIPVSVSGDVSYEPNETFYVNLTNPTNATITRAQGLGTIAND